MITVSKARYHRNGVSGEGFYAFEFTDSDPEYKDIQFVATIFPQYDEEEGEVDWDATANRPFTYNPRIAVVSNGDVDVTWRGDYYLEELCDAAKKVDRAVWHGLPEGYFDDIDGGE